MTDSKSDVKLNENDAALWKAVESNKSDDVVAALKAGANPSAKNADGDTPLHFMVRGGHYKYKPTGIAKLVVEAKADFEAQDKAGLTPLQLACTSGWQNLAQFFIDSGADKTKVADIKSKITCPDVKRVLGEYKLFP